MKKLIAICLIVLNAGCVFSQKKIYLRLYDGNENKIEYGRCIGTTDSGIIMFSKNTGETHEVRYNSIRVIKTKRGVLHNILTTSLATIPVVFALLAQMNAEDRKIRNSTRNPPVILVGPELSDIDVFTLSAIAGTALSTAIGGTTYLAKKKHKWYLNGTKENWVVVRKLLNKAFYPDNIR